MAQLLVRTIADYSTTLVSKTAVGATTATLTSGLDADAVQLPTGTYGFTIDRNNSAKEYFTATLTGASLTVIKTVTRGTGVGTDGLLRVHRKGAEVIISDHVAIKRMMNVLDGTTSLDAATPLGYDGTATISTANQLATKAYADALAIAGSPDSAIGTKGIGRVSVAPASAATPIFVGDNDGRVPTQGENDALVGNNTDIAVGTGNTFVTRTGFQKNAERYAADAGANDTYVITLSPVPTSYATGMVINFKANTVNTGAATINVNSLGAKSIVKGVSTALADGDIAALSLNTLIYDGTNFVLQNPIANLITFKNGVTTRAGDTASGDQTIAHGLGSVPKKIRITVTKVNGTVSGLVSSNGTYNGTTNSCVYGLGIDNGNGTAQAKSGNSATQIAYIEQSQSGATGTQTAIATYDATNIILTWTLAGTVNVSNMNIMWEAEA